MGKKAAEALDISYNDLADYLHKNHSVYMKVGSAIYYLTDVNFEAWRAQDTSRRNLPTAGSYRSTPSSESESVQPHEPLAHSHGDLYRAHTLLSLSLAHKSVQLSPSQAR